MGGLMCDIGCFAWVSCSGWETLAGFYLSVPSEEGLSTSALVVRLQHVLRLDSLPKTISTAEHH